MNGIYCWRVHRRSAIHSVARSIVPSNRTKRLSGMAHTSAPALGSSYEHDYEHDYEREYE